MHGHGRCVISLANAARSSWAAQAHTAAASACLAARHARKRLSHTKDSTGRVMASESRRQSSLDLKLLPWLGAATCIYRCDRRPGLASRGWFLKLQTWGLIFKGPTNRALYSRETYATPPRAADTSYQQGELLERACAGWLLTGLNAELLPLKRPPSFGKKSRSLDFPRSRLRGPRSSLAVSLKLFR